MRQRERRRNYRVKLPEASARCWPREQWQTDRATRRTGRPMTFSVCDLSLGGALLQGDGVYGLQTPLTLRLSLPGQQKPLTLRSKVRRRMPHIRDCSRIAVVFENISAKDEEAIAAAVVWAFQQERSPRALVAEARRHDGRALERAIAELGFTTFRARTPLDAIQLLEDRKLKISLVVLGAHLGSIQALEFAHFLGLSFPSIRRVAVTRNRWRTRISGYGLVDAVVQRPWSPETLARAVCPPCMKSDLWRSQLS